MNLTDKLLASRQVLDEILKRFRRPAVMWSSGKDSMTLLHMLHAAGIHCPVIWHREPWFRHRYEFGERVAREYRLDLWDWPPAGVAVQQEGDNDVEMVNEYQLGTKHTIGLPQSLYEPANGQPFVCAVQDVLHRPRGWMAGQWDVLLLGHKESDIDPTLGPVKLSVDVYLTGDHAAYAYPLRHWTDADVWEYTRRADVPQQTTRYDLQTGKENPDKTDNPDWLPCCARCLDRRQGKTVTCPKLKCTVANISERAPRTSVRNVLSQYCDMPKPKE